MIKESGKRKEKRGRRKEKREWEREGTGLDVVRTMDGKIHIP